MKQIYSNALTQLDKYIKLCGHQLQHVTDEYSLVHWQVQLELTQRRYKRIHKRIYHNVIFIDFVNKKRVA